MENKKIVIGNLKSKMKFSEVGKYLKVINQEVISEQVIICPSNIYIPYFFNNNYQVGLQNVYFDEGGPYTGEITTEQAISMGLKYAIVGHSERRNLLNETTEIINKKVINMINNNMIVILCIGETAEERKLHKTEAILKAQLTRGLDTISGKKLDNVIIAYEPVWAIGTNEVPTTIEIQMVVQYIKEFINNTKNNNNIRVVYGGSVKEENIKEFNQINNLSGFLIGGAALKSEEFLKIIKEVVRN